MQMLHIPNCLLSYRLVNICSAIDIGTGKTTQRSNLGFLQAQHDSDDGPANAYAQTDIDVQD